jgi:hypothetical protein
MTRLAHWHLFGPDKPRSEADELKKRVTALQAALLHYKAVARRSKEVRAFVVAAIAIASFALGFVLGVYNQPVRDFVATVGRVDQQEVPYVAYQKGKYAVALRRLRPLAESGDPRAQSTLASARDPPALPGWQ